MYVGMIVHMYVGETAPVRGVGYPVIMGIDTSASLSSAVQAYFCFSCSIGFVGLLAYWPIGLLPYWFYWSIGLLVLMVYWAFGLLVYGHINVLAY